MPLLRVHGLLQKDPTRVQTALKSACHAIAEAYGCPPSNVWATWDNIQPGLYVEGDQAAESQPEDSHPPIARALSGGLGIPNNVFMTYVEMKAGQVISGDGKIRRK